MHHWQWRSQQGINREDNRDAGGIFVGDTTTLALIVDGSSKGCQGAAFVNDWIRLVINATSEQDAILDKNVINNMELAQIALREKYLVETACYSALLIRQDLKQAWGINCGDCRIGKRDNGKIKWLTSTHTLADFIDDNPQQNQINNQSRHTTTRCLKSRRFMLPETIELDYSATEWWILATDGYHNDAIGDDASSLNLSMSLDVSDLNSDCCNWYERASA